MPPTGSDRSAKKEPANTAKKTLGRPQNTTQVLREPPTSSHSANETADILQWVNNLRMDPSKVIKVLILGNCGAGKSFLCNALLGGEEFEHKNQARSCTATNSFAGVLFGEGTPNQTAYVVCNIPGLIEADPHNIPRNEQAIQAAFNLLPNSPTLLMFVLKNTGGRPLDEDFQAVKCVMDYVKFDTASCCCVVNNVDWDELDQSPDEYRADITMQVRAITQRPQVEVDFVAKLPKEIRANYGHEKMVFLNGCLVALLKKLKPTIIAPAPEAVLTLDKKKLEAAILQLKEEIAAQRAAHEHFVRQERERWDREIAAMKETHERDIAECRRIIKALEERPPTVINTKRRCAMM